MTESRLKRCHSHPNLHDNALIVFVACGWVCFAIFSAAFLLWRSYAVIPVVDGDQTWFYPIYESVAHDGILRHPFASPISMNSSGLNLPNADGGSPLIWHGWLQPLLLGNISRLIGGDISEALLSDGLLIVAGTVLYFFATHRFLTCAPLMHFFGGLITLVALLSYQGRPELLASVLLLGWCNLAFRLSEYKLMFVTPLFLSLLAATQPTVAIIASILLLNFIMIKQWSPHPIRLWVVQNFVAFLILVIVACILYPYHFKDWIYGLYLHSQIQLTRADNVDFIISWIANPLKPLHGLICFTGFIVMLLLALRAPSRAFSIFAVSLAGAVVWLFGLRIPRTNYNVFAFVPSLCVLFVAILASHMHGLLATIWFRSGLRTVITLAGAAAVLPVLIALNSLANDGRSRAELRDFLTQSLAEGKSIAVTPSILIGAVPYNNWVLFKRVERDNLCNTSASIVVVQQANTGLLEPPSARNCTLVLDRYSRIQPSIFGLKLPFTPKGYGFAVYTNDMPNDRLK